MTTQPAAAAFGAYFFVASDPTANRAISHPAKSNVSKSRVFNVVSPKLTSVPNDLRLASAAISVIGNSRSSKMFNISRPTLPVAPTTTTLYPIYGCSFSNAQSLWAWRSYTNWHDRESFELYLDQSKRSWLLVYTTIARPRVTI